MKIEEYRNFNLAEIVSLYKKVGWINYLKLENILFQIVQNLKMLNLIIGLLMLVIN